MKKVLLTIFSTLFILSTSFAQSAEGCDGSRYLAGGVFDEVTMTTVTYGENTSVTGNLEVLQMDVYEPVGDAATMRPVIVLAHGGSFVFGERGDMAGIATEYAKMGYVAVSITYRLYPLFELGFPNETQMIDQVVKAVTDMKSAIRYMRKDAATDNMFKADPNYIVVGGLSAGAITAMHTAHLGLDDQVTQVIQDAVDANGGYEGTTGNDGYSSEVTAVVNMSGGLHDKNYLDADDAPFISMHGDADATVPYNNGQAADVVYIDGSGDVHPVADLVGVDNYLVTVPGGGHTNIYQDNWTDFEPHRIDFAVNGNIFIHNILCPNTVSAATPEVAAQVSVYPNPSSDQMTIDLGTIEANYDLVVYDQVGKVVHTAYNLQGNQVTLAKANFGAGLFVVEVRVMEDGVQSVTRKVIFE